MLTEGDARRLTKIHEALLASDYLHSATRYLAKQFSVEMTRDQAQANVSARTMLVNLQNCALDDAYELSGLTENVEQVELRVVRRIKR
jgi:hypothetical protein